MRPEYQIHLACIRYLPQERHSEQRHRTLLMCQLADMLHCHIDGWPLEIKDLIALSKLIITCPPEQQHFITCSLQNLTYPCQRYTGRLLYLCAIPIVSSKYLEEWIRCYAHARQLNDDFHDGDIPFNDASDQTYDYIMLRLCRATTLLNIESFTEIYRRLQKHYAQIQQTAIFAAAFLKILQPKLPAPPLSPSA
jgi:hypothetical protein